jgi:hypothetical protein
MPQSESHSRFNQLIEFAVDPRQHAALAAALVEQAERLTCTYPGFISASVQASEDGCRVLSQVLWQSRRASEQALLNAEGGEPDFAELMRRYRVTAVTFNAYEVLGQIPASH